MARQRQQMLLVVIAIHVRDLQFCFVDGSFESH
jgi:hypothetical protein